MSGLGSAIAISDRFQQQAAILRIGDHRRLRDLPSLVPKFGVAAGVQRFEHGAQLPGGIEHGPRASCAEPAARFHRGKGNGHAAVSQAFVKAVGQQPVGIQPFLEIVQAPREMAPAVERAQIGRLVGPDIIHPRGVSRQGGQICEYEGGGAACDQHAQPAFHFGGCVSQYCEAARTAEHAEPADRPGRAGGGAGGSFQRIEGEDLVFHQMQPGGEIVPGEIFADEGGGRDHDVIRLREQRGFQPLQQRACHVAFQQQPVQVQAFIDQRGRGIGPMRPAGEREGFQVPADQDVGPFCSFQDPPGNKLFAQDGGGAVQQLPVMRAAQIDHFRSGDPPGGAMAAIEADHQHFGPCGAEHQHAFRHGGIAYVVNEIGDALARDGGAFRRHRREGSCGFRHAPAQPLPAAIAVR